MKYSGPRSFKGLFRNIYSHVGQFLERKDEPHIILGAVSRFEINGDSQDIHIDTGLYRRVDRAFRHMLAHQASVFGTDGLNEKIGNLLWRMQHLKDPAKALFDEFQQALFLADNVPSGVFGLYQGFSDKIFASLNSVARYALTSVVPLESMQETGNKDAIEDYLNSLDVPHRITHELIHWGFGANEYHQRIRSLAQEVGYYFDRDSHGRYDASSGEYFDKGNGGAFASFLDHAKKGKKLGIYLLDEVAAEIIALYISPTHDGNTVVWDNQELVYKVEERCRKQPLDLVISDICQIEDDAYKKNVHVKSLL